MEFFAGFLEILDTQMTAPSSYGWFHLAFFAASILAGVLLCMAFGKKKDTAARKIVFITALIVTALEIYKQINYTFSYEGGVVTADFEWYAFPFQFCSTPMYAGLLAGIIRKGRVHDALCSYLATFSLFAGLCVMFYPSDVFTGTVGINIQTMICHGSMISVAIYLLYSGYVKSEHKTILKAASVFAVAVILAAVMNEIAYYSGLLETETFNMFFISPHCDPSLPVYSLVQKAIAYPWCLIIYIAAFTLASYIILLVSMLIGRLAAKKRPAEKPMPEPAEEALKESITV